MKFRNKLFSLIISFIVILGCFSISSFLTNAATVAPDYVDAYGIEYGLIGTTGSNYTILNGQNASGDVVLSETVNGKTLVQIEEKAFDNNGKLISIQIPKSVTSVGKGAFRDCRDLKSVKFETSDRTVKLKSDSGGTIGVFENCKSISELVLPTKITNITAKCFFGCSSLTSIVIPDGTSTISSRAFEYCSNIKTVTIPDSVNNIMDGAFFNCASIQKFIVDPNNSEYKSVDNVLYTKDGKTLVQYPLAVNNGTYFVRDLTEKIGYGAFANCKLNRIVLPDSVKEIEGYAFANCNNLSKFTFSQNLKEIGINAFLHCSGLKSAVLPSSLDSYECAFADCGLESVKLESGIGEISLRAFNDCQYLSTVIIPASVTKIENGAFLMTNGEVLPKLKLYVEYNSFAYNYAVSNGIPYDTTIPDDLDVPGDNKDESYKITYIVLGNKYEQYNVVVGDAVPKCKAPVIPGYTFVKWDTSIPTVMPAKNIQINAVMVKNPSIVKYTKTRTELYKTSITFYADYDINNDGKLVWVVNGKEYNDDGSGSYKVVSPTESYTIAARLVINGVKIDSDTENVVIQNSFIHKIIYFFRSIFSSGSLDIKQK